jgi:hypothetical protein
MMDAVHVIDKWLDWDSYVPLETLSPGLPDAGRRGVSVVHKNLIYGHVCYLLSSPVRPSPVGGNLRRVVVQG